jgi:hypothetical protein
MALPPAGSVTKLWSDIAVQPAEFAAALGYKMIR